MIGKNFPGGGRDADGGADELSNWTKKHNESGRIMGGMSHVAARQAQREGRTIRWRQEGAEKAALFAVADLYTFRYIALYRREPSAGHPTGRVIVKRIDASVAENWIFTRAAWMRQGCFVFGQPLSCGS